MEKYIQDRVKQVAEDNLVRVISQYLQLSKHGSDYIGLCPFHDDTRPSLHVSESKKVWKCFACGASGDAIEFVRRYNNGIGYAEALQVIADKFSIDTKETPYKLTKHPQRTNMPITAKKPTQPQEIGSIPMPFLLKSMERKGRLFDWLFSYIGTADIAQVWDEYCVGSAKDGAEIFWYFTADNVIRYAKVMDYDTDGHRKHCIGSCYALHPQIIKHMKKHGLWAQDYEPMFKPILFGGHLIADNPHRIVAVVESEKTAIIGACLVPSLTWCAVGGKSNLNAEMLLPTKGHQTLLFPDMDARQEWSVKAQQLLTQGFDIQVVEWWLGVDGLGDKADIADLLLRDLPVMDKFTDEEWDAMAYLEDEPQPTPATTQQPQTEAEALLARMIERSPAIGMLVDKLQLEIVEAAAA